jgi:hypothetical protein
MKKLAALLLFTFLASLPARATVLFHDALNYPNGLIETDGLWQVYSPAPPNSPYGDCYVSNNLIQLVRGNHDDVEAPKTGYNSAGSNYNTYVYASFTIDVTNLPYVYGDYIAEFQNTNDTADVCHVFVRTRGTTVPDTYQLGVANGATSSSATGVQFFPLDLATNTTYEVVILYNSDLSGYTPLAGATLAVNPATESDLTNSPAYGLDSVSYAQAAVINQDIAFRQSSEAQIGDIYVGTNFSDVFPYTPSIPVIGIQPQTTNSYLTNGPYAGDYWTFYTAASGLGALTYHWFQNGSPLTDNGTTILGSTSNILTISNLSATATYYVQVANSAGSADSDVVTLNVNTTPTAPFFTTQPFGATNTEGAYLTLSARANGTGPITYAWYFQETNTTGYVQVGTGSSYTIPSLDYSDDGLYHVVASGPDGNTTSSNVFVLVTAPALVTIGSLHSYMITNPPSSGGTNLANGTAFTVQGVVTCFGQTASSSYTEYRIQDATGGVEIYEGAPTSQAPPVGTWVQAQGTIQQYYGVLEMYYPTITVTNVGTNVPGVNPTSSNNIPLPAPVPLNLSAIQGTNNATSPYGLKIDGSLVTVTNAYIYLSPKGAPLNGKTFPGNPGNSIDLYVFSGPYDAVTNTNYVEAFVVTYENISNQLNTNFWGVAVPSYCYELTGVYESSSDYGPQIEPSRLQDFVTNAPASFSVNIGVTNRQTTLTWPASTHNNTYSVYSAPTVNGPWTQKFGLSYYPSTGTYTVTNTNSAQFFWMTSP